MRIFVAFEGSFEAFDVSAHESVEAIKQMVKVCIQSGVTKMGLSFIMPYSLKCAGQRPYQVHFQHKEQGGFRKYPYLFAYYIDKNLVCLKILDKKAH